MEPAFKAASGSSEDDFRHRVSKNAQRKQGLQTGWIRRSFLDLNGAKDENVARTNLNKPDLAGIFGLALHVREIASGTPL
jgi:hypothetical protein